MKAFLALFEKDIHYADGSVWFNPSTKVIEKAFRDAGGYLRGTMLYNVVKDCWAFTDDDIVHGTLARKCSWSPEDCLHFYIYPKDRSLSFSYNAYSKARDGNRYFDPELLKNNSYWKWMLSHGWKAENLRERPQPKQEITDEDRDLLAQLDGVDAFLDNLPP